MTPEQQLQAKLEQAAAGKAPRPRGHSVTAAERAAVAPFANACHALVDHSLHIGSHGEEGEITRLPAPAAALPPLP